MVPLFYDLTTFGQKFVKFFVGFVEKLKKAKRHSEIKYRTKGCSGQLSLSILFPLVFLIFESAIVGANN